MRINNLEAGSFIESFLDLFKSTSFHPPNRIKIALNTRTTQYYRDQIDSAEVCCYISQSSDQLHAPKDI